MSFQNSGSIQLSTLYRLETFQQLIDTQLLIIATSLIVDTYSIHNVSNDILKPFYRCAVSCCQNQSCTCSSKKIQLLLRVMTCSTIVTRYRILSSTVVLKPFLYARSKQHASQDTISSTIQRFYTIRIDFSRPRNRFLAKVKVSDDFKQRDRITSMLVLVRIVISISSCQNVNYLWTRVCGQ